MADKFGNKTGGRKKGTPNKKSLELLQKLEELNYEPLEKLIIIANDDKTSTELKVKINLELLSYIYPKKKAVAMDITKYIGKVSEKKEGGQENE